MYTFAYL
jgi:HrpA-like RNA helicase